MQSVPGEGSTFTVKLPRVPFSTRDAAAGETQDASAAQDTEALKLSASDPRILIVDDVPLNMSVIKAMLRRLGIPTDLPDGMDMPVYILETDDQ